MSYASAPMIFSEALEQQTATSEILRVISTSPTDVQPVFDTIARKALSLCGSLFANVFRFDGELLHFIASNYMRPDHVGLLEADLPHKARLVSGLRTSTAHEIGG